MTSPPTDTSPAAKNSALYRISAAAVLPALMGSVGLAFAAGSMLVAASGSALTGSDPMWEVSRQTVRLLVVRRFNGCWDVVPRSVGEHSCHEIAARLLLLPNGGMTERR